jgi:inosose dehydratase
MAVRLAINPLTWTNDDMPELGGDTPLEVCLSEAKQAGYDGVELGNKFPRRADALRPILARHDLALASGWYGAKLLAQSAREEIESMEPHLDLLAAMGCQAMVFAEVTGSVHGERKTSLGYRPRLRDDDWKRLGDRMTEVARHTLRHGVRLAYHHHMGTVIETEEEIGHLMAATGPEVGLLLDTGHLAYAGGDPVALAERHGPRIAHVHCKDVRAGALATARAGKWSFLDAVLAGVFTVPGDGCVDYASLLPVLKSHQYGGWLVVEAEQDPAKAHPLTYARMGHDYLRPLAQRAGL